VGELVGGAAPPVGATAAQARAVAKRAFDVLVSGLLLVALAPFIVLVALLVRLTSPGPALFRQTRLGQHGRPFVMYKFRTMTAGCSDDLHREYVSRLLSSDDPAAAGRSGLYKLDADPRVTRLGGLLRRTSIDELPQLLNVLRGDMSIVGPRPILPWERALLPPAYQARFSVPAGLTGLWQVSGRSRLTFTQALELDVEYVRRWTFALDLLIVLKTAWVLLVSSGSAR
jgi:lipopolysaccharide/colanic/teichoic acid biosynthesis glycosyltransferase